MSTSHLIHEISHRVSHTTHWPHGRDTRDLVPTGGTATSPGFTLEQLTAHAASRHRAMRQGGRHSS